MWNLASRILECCVKLSAFSVYSRLMGIECDEMKEKQSSRKCAARSTCLLIPACFKRAHALTCETWTPGSAPSSFLPVPILCQWHYVRYWLLEGRLSSSLAVADSGGTATRCQFDQKGKPKKSEPGEAVRPSPAYPYLLFLLPRCLSQDDHLHAQRLWSGTSLG